MEVHVSLKNMTINKFIKLGKLFFQFCQFLKSFLVVGRKSCKVDRRKGEDDVLILFVFQVEKGCFNRGYLYSQTLETYGFHFHQQNIPVIFLYIAGKLTDPVILFRPLTFLQHVVEG